MIAAYAAFVAREAKPAIVEVVKIRTQINTD
jgi:hypothetical protein